MVFDPNSVQLLASISFAYKKKEEGIMLRLPPLLTSVLTDDMLSRGVAMKWFRIELHFSNARLLPCPKGEFNEKPVFCRTNV